MKWTDQIKDVCKISEVVSKYCKITRQSAGKYLVKCPFHNEKTPSCTVDDARNIFYCFGCKVGGDAIRFVQMIESIDFVSACNKIAEWYGINLVKQDARPHSDAGKQITEWLSDCLKKNHNVMEYLFSRGLAEGTIDKFRLGWMGDKGGFLNFCTKNNISNDDLEDLGIKNSMLFLFENRIIFPILENDRTIGFGGRKFYKNDDRCKYINSSEARYFKKKKCAVWVQELRKRNMYR